MAESGLSKSDVIVGVPLCRRTSFVLDKFLSNQQEIQQAYPHCHLILATNEPDFVAELREQIDHYNLKGEVIAYKTVKPDYARGWAWNVACGREALRQYVLSQGAEYFLSFDGDMVYDPLVISIMKSKIQGADVVSSGYWLRLRGIWGLGGGCVMINRKILNRITFGCYEFKNGQVLYEDTVLYMTLFRCRARLNSGIFVSIKHYVNSHEYYAIEPQPTGWFRTVTNSLLVKYLLTRMSILVRHDMAYKLGSLLVWTGKAELKSD